MTAAENVPGMPKVTVVVVHWGPLETTLECLRSLDRISYPDYEVIVVDNGSQDGRALAQHAPRSAFVLLRQNKNLGFAGGNNVGIRAALTRGAAFLWLLNNDVTVDPESLTVMMRRLTEDESAGITGSVIRPRHDKKQIEAWGGGHFNPYLATTRRATTPSSRIGYIAGTSMLIRRETLEDVGLLDETFFFYLEDVDLCYRARLRGWKLNVAPSATVYHRGGASVNDGRAERSELADRYHARSTGVFMGKYAGSLLPILAPLRIIAIVIRRIGRRQFRAIPHLVLEFLRGIRSGRVSSRATHSRALK